VEIEPMPEIAENDGLLTIKQHCEIYNCSRSYTYELLAKGELAAVKDGRITKISRASARARAARLKPFQSRAQLAA
jgi:excisionase family DNA binding protein